MDRRDFLKILGITSSSAMISSCGVDKVNEKIIPYVIPPEEEIYPGKALYVNTTCTECPAHCGLQVTVKEKVYHDQRGLYPTKLEGIEGHPINDGALCMRGQAGLFRLYHPERIKRPLLREENGNLKVITWSEAFQRIEKELHTATSQGRENIYFASRTTGSLSELIDEFCRKKGIRRSKEFEMYSYSNLREANRLLFNRPEIPAYQIDKSDFLLTLGADLFETFISPVHFAAQFARVKKNSSFTWYHLEPHLSLTGVQATRRWILKAGSEGILLSYLIRQISELNLSRKKIPSEFLRILADDDREQTAQLTGISEDKIQTIINKLTEAQRPLIIAGGISTAHSGGLEVAGLTALLQWQLGMVGEQIDFSTAENYQTVGSWLDLENLLNQLKKNSVGVFFISRFDPLSQLPADLKFQDHLKKASFRIGLSEVLNETVRQCDLILPLSHALESWGDAVPHAGLRTVMQPAIEPQFDSQSEGDILLKLLGSAAAATSYQEYLFSRWRKDSDETALKEFLERGYRSEKKEKVQPSLNSAQTLSLLQGMRLKPAEYSTAICFSPSIRTFDGRSRHLALLQEVPDPLTTITYGEWVSISQKKAEQLQLENRDEVQLTAASISFKLPVKIQKLLPEEMMMVQRDLSALPITIIDRRSGEISWIIAVTSISKTGQKIAIPILAGSMTEEGRGMLPVEEEHGHQHAGEHEPWYPKHEHKDYRWGMAVDLESCIGCNACVAACYVENNIPLVGLQEHLLGREMSWIRIQPYFDKEEEIEFVPMLCQHCDNAPCEAVCPVYAAYHNAEGLNVQVYNRCVGTRYCSNNCPYKVRRFNWFDHHLPEPLDKMYNPDLSVRGRGIMEKCTFCIQRIRAAKDQAKDASRLVKDGEIVPACAQTCPTNAITFGNLEDKNSQVYQLAQSSRTYRALEELGTQPAVHYLRKRGDKHEA